MENRRPWNRNPSSSSSYGSFSRSPRPRGQKLAPNATQNPKSPAFARRGTTSTASTSNSDSRLCLNTRRQAQEEHVDVEWPSDIGFVVGTCPYMCPERERNQREQLRDLAVFERLNGFPGKSSPGLAVKKFCRTISTKHIQTSDVRPLPILEDTLKYLLSLLDSKEHPYEVVHDFLFDRTRSIRQDLTMQNIVNEKAINMYEEMVKFHVISHYRLRSCLSNPIIASMHHLNLEQLTKTLTSLFSLYDTNRKSNYVFENEAEFRSLYVLLHLGSYNKPMVNPYIIGVMNFFCFVLNCSLVLGPKLKSVAIFDLQGESLSLWFSHVCASVLKSKEMYFARRILRSFRIGNYKHFFCTTAAQASYLQYCIMEPYVNQVRALALSCINFGGYKLHPYPLVDISKLLMMKESDVESFCNACGLETCTDESGNKVLPTKQPTFCHPKGEFQRYTFLGLEEYEC